MNDKLIDAINEIANLDDSDKTNIKGKFYTTVAITTTLSLSWCINCVCILALDPKYFLKVCNQFFHYRIQYSY